jgi:hypothetical protein
MTYSGPARAAARSLATSPRANDAFGDRFPTQPIAGRPLPGGTRPRRPAHAVFEDECPAVANLDPELLGALRQAATDAADDGVEFVVTIGWRSREYQDELLREATNPGTSSCAPTPSMTVARLDAEPTHDPRMEQ